MSAALLPPSSRQASQRFVVGTDRQQRSLVLVYDLRTASKFRVLEGHDSGACSVSAVAISDDGESVASYAADERPTPCVRVWRLAASGFFAGLLGVAATPAHTFRVPAISALNAAEAAAAANPLRASGEALQTVLAAASAAAGGAGGSAGGSAMSASSQLLQTDLVLQNVRLRFASVNRVVLVRENRSECAFDC